jgi:diacylglycerol kinase family enzyme
LKYLPVVKKGEHLGLDFIRVGKTRKISVSSTGLLPAHLDGEYMEASQFDIEVSGHPFLFIY